MTTSSKPAVASAYSTWAEVHRYGSSVYRWLHADIAAVPDDVLGVHAAEALRSTGEIETTQGTKIVYGLVEDLDKIIADFRPTVIVAGELIELSPETRTDPSTCS